MIKQLIFISFFLNAIFAFCQNKDIELLAKTLESFPNNTEISICKIKNGNATFLGSKKENDTIFKTQNRDKIFPIASLTKVFTSTLLANLIIDKTIKLNDHINNHLDFKFKNDIQITFKQLANHTSLLPFIPSNLDLEKVNLYNPYRAYDKKKLQEYLANDLKLIEQPTYSNTGYGLLAYTISNITNTNYESFIQKKIFKKYGMSNSTTNKELIKQKLIRGLDPEGNFVSNWTFSSMIGAGGIYSNVEDLSKFLVAQFDENNKELVLTRKSTTKSKENFSSGLGWGIIKEKERTLFLHSGGTGGYSSFMIVDVKNRDAVVFLSNISTWHKDVFKMNELCSKLLYE